MAARHHLVPTNRTDRNATSLHVLIVDEDADDRRMIAEYLKRHDICASSTNKADDIKYKIISDDYDLAILDLSIGQDEGLSLLYDIRSQFNLPVIVTAPSHLDENARVTVLELGADDCITKPFGPRELLARIYAILRGCRRLPDHAPYGPLPSPPKPRYCRFGGWQLDRRTRRVTGADGAHVPLTKSEYALLAAFTNAPMVTLSREQLLQATRVIHEDLCDRAIDVQILRLRRKLQLEPEMGGIIRTVRGVGYMFVLPVENVERNAGYQPLA